MPELPCDGAPSIASPDHRRASRDPVRCQIGSDGLSELAVAQTVAKGTRLLPTANDRNVRHHAVSGLETDVEERMVRKRS